MVSGESIMSRSKPIILYITNLADGQVEPKEWKERAGDFELNVIEGPRSFALSAADTF